MPTYVVSSLKRFIAQTAVLFSAGAAFAADPPPTTITPDYSPHAVVQEKPNNISALRTLLSGALGSSGAANGGIDSQAFYILHRTTFDINSSAFNDDGWYIYYQPWDKVGGLGWLDDPLIRGNYKRGRIYGSTNLHLVPVILLPSAADFLKADSAAIQALETQAAQAIATDATLKLHTALGNPAVLLALVQSWRGPNLPALTAAETADPASLLPALHIVQAADSPYLTIDVEHGDRLAGSKPSDFSLADTSQLGVLEKLSAWIVRETLIAYSQNSKDKMASIAEVLWKTKAASKPLAVSSLGASIYVPTEVLSGLPNYKVTVTAREPQPSSDFKALLGLIPAHGLLLSLHIDSTDKAFKSLFPGNAPVAETADERVRVGALPVDMTIEAINPADSTSKPGAAPKTPADGQNTQSSNALSSVKLQNEKKYHYGIGVGLPVKSFDDVQYDSTNGIITAKKVQKQNVFGFFELHPYATDTTGTRLRLLPTFMAGLPISGKVLDQQIYAAGWGLWKVEVFFGVLVHRDLVPTAAAASSTTPSVGATAGSLYARWGTRATYGINVPISVVKSALSSKSSNTSTNSSSTTTPPKKAGAGSPGGS